MRIFRATSDRPFESWIVVARDADDPLAAVIAPTADSEDVRIVRNGIVYPLTSRTKIANHGGWVDPVPGQGIDAWHLCRDAQVLDPDLPDPDVRKSVLDAMLRRRT